MKVLNLNMFCENLAFVISKTRNPLLNKPKVFFSKQQVDTLLNTTQHMLILALSSSS